MPPPSRHSPFTLFVLNHPLFFLIGAAIAVAVLWNWTRPAPRIDAQPAPAATAKAPPTPIIEPWDDLKASLPDRFRAALTAGRVDAAKRVLSQRTVGTSYTRREGLLPELIRAAAEKKIDAMVEAFDDQRYDNIDIAVALSSFPAPQAAAKAAPTLAIEPWDNPDLSPADRFRAALQAHKWERADKLLNDRHLYVWRIDPRTGRSSDRKGEAVSRLSDGVQKRGDAAINALIDAYRSSHLDSTDIRIALVHHIASLSPTPRVDIPGDMDGPPHLKH